MTASNSILKLELKNFKCNRNIVVLVIFFVLVLLIVQVHISNYKKTLKAIDTANELEILKASQFDRYSPYSVYGIRLYGKPSIMNFLLAMDVYGSITAAVDTGTKLEIYESKKDKSILPDNVVGIMNFPMFLLIIGSLLAMFYGYPAFSNAKKLKFFIALSDYKKVFYKLLLSRSLYLSLTILLLLAFVAILGFLNGINLFNKYFLLFALLIIALLNLALHIGALIGTKKKTKYGLALIITIFFVLNILIPWGIFTTINSIAGPMFEYDTEYEKLKILMAIERKGITKFGTIESSMDLADYMEDAIENEWQIIFDLEKKHKQRMVQIINTYDIISKMFPPIFYMFSANEMSGSGYNNYFLFYTFAEDGKIKFIKFYIDKEFRNKPKPGIVESYVKGDNNIFTFNPSLPSSFFIGIILTFLYSLILVFFTYRNAYRKIFEKTGEIENEIKFYTEMEKGQPHFLFTDSEPIKAKIYNHITGKEELKGELLIPMIAKPSDLELAYIPAAQHFDHISPNTLHRFLFGEKLESPKDNWEILAKYAMTREIVVFDDFLKNQPPDRINEVLLAIEDRDLFCLIITDDYYMVTSAVQYKKDFHHFPGDPLGTRIKDSLKESLKPGANQ